MKDMFLCVDMFSRSEVTRLFYGGLAEVPRNLRFSPPNF